MPVNILPQDTRFEKNQAGEALQSGLQQLAQMKMNQINQNMQWKNEAKRNEPLFGQLKNLNPQAKQALSQASPEIQQQLLSALLQGQEPLNQQVGQQPPTQGPQVEQPKFDKKGNVELPKELPIVKRKPLPPFQQAQQDINDKEAANINQQLEQERKIIRDTKTPVEEIHRLAYSGKLPSATKISLVKNGPKILGGIIGSISGILGGARTGLSVGASIAGLPGAVVGGTLGGLGGAAAGILSGSQFNTEEYLGKEYDDYKTHVEAASPLVDQVFGGGLSQQQKSLAHDSIDLLSKTPEGRKYQADTLMLAYKAMEAHSTIANNIKQEFGGYTPDNFDQRIDAKYKPFYEALQNQYLNKLSTVPKILENTKKEAEKLLPKAEARQAKIQKHEGRKERLNRIKADPKKWLLSSHD